MDTLWPEELKGVYHTGCIERGKGSRFRRKAHAHISGKWEGWICFLSSKRMSCEPLVLHELAHILTKQGHTRRFKEKLLEIGGTIDEVPGIMGSLR